MAENKRSLVYRISEDRPLDAATDQQFVADVVEHLLSGTRERLSNVAKTVRRSQAS